MPDFVKMVFLLEVDGDGFPPVSSESLNARREPHGFVLENTPFFASGVALGDRVSASPAPGIADTFIFEQVIESSSNTSLSIIFLDLAIKEVVHQEFRQRGCYCEYGTFGRDDDLQMLAVSIPSTCDYDGIVLCLGEREAQGQLSYAELAVWP